MHTQLAFQGSITAAVHIYVCEENVCRETSRRNAQANKQGRRESGGGGETYLLTQKAAKELTFLQYRIRGRLRRKGGGL